MKTITQPRSLRTHASRGAALALSALLLLPAAYAPCALAQDDDMPDGDVDIVEKPKKKDPPKKEEKKADPKKEEKKAPPKEEPKKEEPKKEEPKKEEPKKEEAKKEPKKDSGRKPIGAAPTDDDDILTVPASAVPEPKPEPKSVPVAPLATDDAAAGEAGGSRVLVGDDDVPAPPSSRLLEDEPPAAPIEAPVDDEEPAPEAKPVVTEGDPTDTKTIETAPEEPEDAASSTPWIIAGAAGGGALLLAGAGVGAFLLVSALTATPSGTLTVTPH